MRFYTWIGLGGMIGASLRYLTSVLFSSTSRSLFPWETFIVNLSGAFILALIMFSPWMKEKIPHELYPLFTTGVLGAFTTFSTLIVETVVLFQVEKIIAITYIITTVLGGLLLSALAFLLMRLNPKQKGEV